MNVSVLKHIFYCQVSFAALYILSLFNISRHEYLYLAAFSVLLILLRPNFKFQIIALISLVFHLIPDPISQAFFENAAPVYFSLSFVQLHLVSMTLCLSLCLWLVSNIKSGRLRISHFKLLIIFVILVIMASILYKTTQVFLPLYILICFARFIWPLCYLLASPLTQEQSNKVDNVTLMGLLAPFWSYGLYYLPVPLGPQMLFRYEAKSDEEFKASVLSGMKLMALTAFLTFLFLLSFLYFYGRPNLVFPYGLSLQEFLRSNSILLPNVFFQSQSFADPNIAFGKKALSLIIQDLFFVIELFPTFGVAIALARLSGIRLPRMIYRPLQARSFVQYMGSFLYYYQQLLFKLFVIPALELKRTVKFNRKLLIGIALLAGGFLFHYLRDLIYDSGAAHVGEFTMKYSQVFIYLFIISYAVTVRSARDRSHSYLRVLMYFLIHPFVILSIMFVTRAGHNFAEFGQFLKGYFGL